MNIDQWYFALCFTCNSATVPFVTISTLNHVTVYLSTLIIQCLDGSSLEIISTTLEQSEAGPGPENQCENIF